MAEQFILLPVVRQAIQALSVPGKAVAVIRVASISLTLDNLIPRCLTNSIYLRDSEGSLPTNMKARKSPSKKNVEKGKRLGLLKRSFAILGPGLITGAADDDPSGISTYSVAGAAYGYSTLWIALLTFPLMASIQRMCARLGMVTGRGLAAAVRMHYPRWVLWGSCSIFVVANIIIAGTVR